MTIFSLIQTAIPNQVLSEEFAYMQKTSYYMWLQDASRKKWERSSFAGWGTESHVHPGRMYLLVFLSLSDGWLFWQEKVKSNKEL